MKKGLKKNYIGIGALALMIAIAGYLNYHAGTADDKTMAELSMEETVLYDLSEEDLAMLQDMDGLTAAGSEQAEDMLLSENLAVAGGEVESLEEAEAVITKDYIDEEMAQLMESIAYYEDAEPESSGQELETASLTQETSVQELETASLTEEGSGLTIEDIPGEAVFTAGNGITSLASARLLKEQNRAASREALLSVVNSETADDVSRQQATDGILELNKQAEKETAAEILLEAKGYTEVVVSISGDSADVVVGMSGLSTEQCAQIIDAVARKTEIPAENIIITPAVSE